MLNGGGKRNRSGYVREAAGCGGAVLMGWREFQGEGNSEGGGKEIEKGKARGSTKYAKSGNLRGNAMRG